MRSTVLRTHDGGLSIVATCFHLVLARLSFAFSDFFIRTMRTGITRAPGQLGSAVPRTTRDDPRFLLSSLSFRRHPISPETSHANAKLLLSDYQTRVRKNIIKQPVKRSSKVYHGYFGSAMNDYGDVTQ